MKNLKKLSRNELSKVNGGGTCAAFTPATTLYNSDTGEFEVTGSTTLVGMSMADARAWANTPGGRWCCDSCGSASWLS
jgi:hypothetical protein